MIVTCISPVASIDSVPSYIHAIGEAIAGFRTRSIDAIRVGGGQRAAVVEV